MKKWLELFENTTDNTNIEKGLKKFCEKRLGWTFYNSNYPIIIHENEITIIPDDVNIDLDDLMILKAIGKTIVISGATHQWAISIAITNLNHVNIKTLSS